MVSPIGEPGADRREGIDAVFSHIKTMKTKTNDTAHSEAISQQRFVLPSCSARLEFEAWIKSPPYERDVYRYPNDAEHEAWPGHYRIYEVQLAWEAWRDSRNFKQNAWHDLLCELDEIREYLDHRGATNWAATIGDVQARLTRQKETIKALDQNA